MNIYVIMIFLLLSNLFVKQSHIGFFFCCSIEKDEGPSHEKRFMSSVKIATIDGVLYMKGDEKSRVRDADNSAASLMIRALQEYRYI